MAENGDNCIGLYTLHCRVADFGFRLLVAKNGDYTMLSFVHYSRQCGQGLLLQLHDLHTDSGVISKISKGHA